MSRQLRPIDDDVYAALQACAVPLEDDVNSVLRRLLGLTANQVETETETVASAPGQITPDVSTTPTTRTHRAPARRPQSTGSRTRAARGSILPESEYELPILRALDLLGGSVPTRDVMLQLEKDLDPILVPADRGLLGSGDVRWRNRAQFVRLRLVRRGDMKSGSPHGVWEISDQGRARVNGAS